MTGPNLADLELLEAAAKAAGIEFWSRGACGLLIASDSPDRSDYCWSPLADDGDALRLAVKRQLRIDHTPHAVHVGTCGDDGEDLASEPVHQRGPTRESATRRAIVRAAVAMERQR
jgi:hypothetical protein